MTSKPSAAVAAAAKRDGASQSSDKLEQVRQIVRDYRDLSIQVQDTEEALKRLKAEQLQLQQKTLPDLFMEVGVDNLGLPAEGNLPAYDAELKPYYHANISSDWPPEQQRAAYAYLDELGEGDLIRSTFTVFVGKDDRETALKVQEALEKLGVDYETKLAVPWNTLTAWLKEQVEKHKTTPRLDLLGATVGNVVKLKQRKE